MNHVQEIELVAAAITGAAYCAFDKSPKVAELCRLTFFALIFVLVYTYR